MATKRDDAELIVRALERVVVLDVRCPGLAHAHGEACVICDPECDGHLEVLLTYGERDALCSAARGLPFDGCFAPRLVKLGLLEVQRGGYCLTARGTALVADHARALS